MKYFVKSGLFLLVLTGVVLGGSSSVEPLSVGSDRQLFCDRGLVNERLTTAEVRVHHPERAEKDPVFVFDRPWEGDSCAFNTIFKDGDVYRMYYGGGFTGFRPNPKFVKCGQNICYAESKNGKDWIRPSLGRYEFAGSRDNNIFYGFETSEDLDNVMVFKDPNPACRTDELYKMIIQYMPKGTKDCGLWLFASPNPTDFRPVREIIRRGPWAETKERGGVLIDTQNVVFWDSQRSVYHLYTRGYHRRFDDRNGDTYIRDIRHATSADFMKWTEPELLDFGPDAEDYPLYTNLVSPYERAPKLFIGFPVRYNERRVWSDNYDNLPSPEWRKARMKIQPRLGFNVSDCVFMCSRDGQRFDRYDEAFMRPGSQHAYNWVYGDCYLRYGRLITPGRFGDDPELSLFAGTGHLCGEGERLYRYCLRMDGFVSYHAPYETRQLVTRDLIFDGDEFVLNFATSARGFVRIAVRSRDGEILHSAELFGDQIDRKVSFSGGTLAEFSGKAVRLEFEMSDADIYSFKFNKQKGGQK